MLGWDFFCEHLTLRQKDFDGFFLMKTIYLQAQRAMFFIVRGSNPSLSHLANSPAAALSHVVIGARGLLKECQGAWVEHRGVCSASLGASSPRVLI